MTDPSQDAHSSYLTIREQLADKSWLDHDLALGEFRLGRDEQAEVRLQARDVSRLHATVIVGPRGASLRDLDSKNGVFVNDERVNGERQLMHGDLITLGSAVLDVRFPEHVLSGVLHDVGELTLTYAGEGKQSVATSLDTKSLVWPILGVAVTVAALVALWLL